MSWGDHPTILLVNTTLMQALAGRPAAAPAGFGCEGSLLLPPGSLLLRLWLCLLLGLATLVPLWL